MNLEPVVILTGAGSGIGRATAIELSARGARLVLAGRRTELLEETGSMLGTAWHAVQTDVRDPVQCGNLIRAAVERFETVDALVNNAGWAPCQPIGKHTPDLIRHAFEINAIGPAQLIADVWPVFEARASEGLPGGCIVNVSSMATIDPFNGLFAYAAAKTALNSMIRSCHREGADLGIRCFAVAPGAVDTEMLRSILSEDLLPNDRTIAPQAVASVIADCVDGTLDAKMGETLYMPMPETNNGPN